MVKIINEIFYYLKKNKTFVIFAFVVVLLGIILGFVLKINESFLWFYNNYLCAYLNFILGIEVSAFAVFIKRILSNAILLILVGIFSLNKYTVYLNFIILLYRAFTIGVAGKLLILQSAVTGSVLFLFLILVQGLFVCFSIVLFFIMIKDKLSYAKNLICYSVNAFIICFSISVVGALLEFLFVITLFKPLSLFF